MALGYDVVKDWARNNRMKVCEIAQRFSGGFGIALTQLFSHADDINTEKILDNWPDEFKKLYQLLNKKGQ